MFLNHVFSQISEQRKEAAWISVLQHKDGLKTLNGNLCRLVRFCCSCCRNVETFFVHDFFKLHVSLDCCVLRDLNLQI